MTKRRGLVRLRGQRVGMIVETEGGMRFTYDSDWLDGPGAEPISHTLPLRSESYDASGLHPLFENLLPEGWLLELATTKLKLSKDDGFGLLLATCADCVGAVEIVQVAASSEVVQ